MIQKFRYHWKKKNRNTRKVLDMKKIKNLYVKELLYENKENSTSRKLPYYVWLEYVYSVIYLIGWSYIKNK